MTLKVCAQDAAEAGEVHLDIEMGQELLVKDSPAPPPKPSPWRALSIRACDPGSSWTLLRKYPRLIIAPAVLLCLIVALSVFGIMYAMSDSYEFEGQQARDAVISAADGLVQQLSSASRAVQSLAAVVRMNPQWPFLEANFLVLAKELFRQSKSEGNLVLRELAFIPFGRVRADYGSPIQRNSTADMFSPQLVQQVQPYPSMEQRGLTISGPNTLSTGGDRVIAARFPVFFSDVDEDESWGHPDNITHPTNCPGPPCYDPEKREKFWGFIGALVNAEPLLAGDNIHLRRLVSDGLSYLLTTSGRDGTADVILSSGGSYSSKVTYEVAVKLPGAPWALSVYNPRQKRILEIRAGLIAMVVVAALILSGLLLMLLVSGKQASVLLEEQLVTNKLLQEEKVSREALLGRQLDLIACFDQTMRRTRNKNRSDLSDGQVNTLDQIAAAKASIAETRRSKDEDIAIEELLAEGSFGKVY